MLMQRELLATKPRPWAAMSVAVIQRAGVLGFVIILFFLGVQTLFSPLEEGKLNGVTNEPSNIPWSWSNWRGGELQKQIESWIERRVAFRAFLVRTDNEIRYRFTTHDGPHVREAGSIVRGKHGSLFGTMYVQGYRDSPTLDAQYLDDFARQVRRLQDHLNDRGIVFLFVVSPSKTTIYPEDLPDWVHRKRPIAGPSKLGLLRPVLSRESVDWSDTVSLLVDFKAAKPDRRLFPNTGLHWGEYGAAIALESITVRLNALSAGRIDNVEIQHVRLDTKCHGDENDLGKLVNRWSSSAGYVPYPHVDVHKTRRHSPSRPRVLVVGCSFCWQILSLMERGEWFESLDFMFYANTRHHYPGHDSSPTTPDQIATLVADGQYDLVIVEQNEALLNMPPGYGFVKAAIERFASLANAGRPVESGNASRDDSPERVR